MSRMVDAKELGKNDMFELPNGSVYVVQRQAVTTGLKQARLWCAHPPDPMTFEPPLIDCVPSQQVLLLTGAETRAHYRHEGLVGDVFAREMERRNQSSMRAVHERQNQGAEEQRRRDLAARPWWRKVLG